MDPNRHHEFIGSSSNTSNNNNNNSNEERSRTMYYSRGMEDARTHAQFFSQAERSVGGGVASNNGGSKKPCGCPGAPGNLICNNCQSRPAPAAVDGCGWSAEPRPEFRSADPRTSAKQSALYVHPNAAGRPPYWGALPAYAKDSMALSKPIERSLLSKVEPNYAYKSTPSSSLQLPPTHQGSVGLPVGAMGAYCKDPLGVATKLGYASAAGGATAIYNIEGSHGSHGAHSSHGGLGSHSIALETMRGAKIDQHVINPSNMIGSKEQHPSPNYARKCPQIFSPDEQNSAHHNLYMPPPQFSSDKFTNIHTQQQHQQKVATRESPQHEYRRLSGSKGSAASAHLNVVLPDVPSTKLRESPLQQMPAYSSSSPSMMGQKFHSLSSEPSPLQPHQLQEQTSYGGGAGAGSGGSLHSRNAKYYSPSPSKVHTPEMSPIIMKQSPIPHTHYQYSSSPLPSSVSASASVVPLHQQTPMKTVADYMKKEDDLYGGDGHHGMPASRSLYVNPYNTHTPPAAQDMCCKEAPSPLYSTTPSPQAASYHHSVSGKYHGKLPLPPMAMSMPMAGPLQETLTASSNKLSGMTTHGTPPTGGRPSSSFRGQPYYYETPNHKYDGGYHHSSPSPAAATAASPSQTAAALSTSQTQLHHNDYATQLHPHHHQQSHAHTLAHTHQYHHGQQQQAAPQPQPPPHPHSTDTHRTPMRLQHELSASTSHQGGGGGGGGAGDHYERQLHQQQQQAAAIAAAKLGGQHGVPSKVQPSPPAPPPLPPQAMLQSTAAVKSKTHAPKPNYRELINQVYAMRSATSEEELNRQIIKKTLNVDTQVVRVGSGHAPMPAPPQIGEKRIQPSPGPHGLAPPLSSPSSTYHQHQPHHQHQHHHQHQYQHQHNRRPEIVVTPPTALPKLLSDTRPLIKLEEKPNSYPLDLSMRTVKTKADSTEYKYRRLTPTQSPQNVDCKYTLPRVDFTPNFSLHAAAASDERSKPYERGVYTSPDLSHIPAKIEPPEQQQPPPPLPPGLPPPKQYFAAHSFAAAYESKSQRHSSPVAAHYLPPQPSANELLPTGGGTSNNSPSLVIKSVPPQLHPQQQPLPLLQPTQQQQQYPSPPQPPQNQPHPQFSQSQPQLSVMGQCDMGVMCQPCRPTVLESNPYATAHAVKSEIRLSDKNLLAVEQLPPDTSIMPLPKRLQAPPPTTSAAISKSYEQQPAATTAPHMPALPPTPTTPSQPPKPTAPVQSAYSLACERNPNFLGRKRHLQEYSNANKYNNNNKPAVKQQRFQPEPAAVPKESLSPQPQLPQPHQPPQPLPQQQAPSQQSPPQQQPTIKPEYVRPTELSVIAVNECAAEQERKRGADPAAGRELLMAAARSPSIIVVDTQTICKQEPVTPTADVAPMQLQLQQPPPSPSLSTLPTTIKTETTFSMAARIRTKAELKGFTFSPPVMATPPAPPSPVPEPPIRIKEEPPTVSDAPCTSTIPGLTDDFSRGNLLDFTWNITCNSLVEQLLINPHKPPPKKRCKAEPSEDEAAAANAGQKKDVADMDYSIGDSNSISNMESASTNVSYGGRAEHEANETTVTKSISQDTTTAFSQQASTLPLLQKKISKMDREKMRLQQEKRIAARLQGGSSSESDNELDKRKTERLKKPLKKNGGKTRPSPPDVERNRFSDCGSDSTSADSNDDGSDGDEDDDDDGDDGDDGGGDASRSCGTSKADQNPNRSQNQEQEQSKNSKNSNANADAKANTNAPIGAEGGAALPAIDANKNRIKIAGAASVVNMNVGIGAGTGAYEAFASLGKRRALEAAKADTEEKQRPKCDQVQYAHMVGKRDRPPDQNRDAGPQPDDDVTGVKSKTTNEVEKSGADSALEADMETEACGDKLHTKVSLNTMTRSKRKRELELQLANSKVLRNEKIIRNSTTKIKRKYVRKFNSGQQAPSIVGAQDAEQSKEEGTTGAAIEIMSTRLRSKNAKSIVNHAKHKSRRTGKDKEKNGNRSGTPSPNAKGRERQSDIYLEVYHYKRSLKVPASLISIKHPSNHRIAASLPDHECDVEDMTAVAASYVAAAQKRLRGERRAQQQQAPPPPPPPVKVEDEGPRSIIDLLHSRVLQSHPVRATKAAAKSAAKASQAHVYGHAPNTANAVQNHSETSQNTESNSICEAPLALPLMLPALTLKRDSDDEEADGKRRHFSIFETKVLQTKTRTESKLQQKREIIREIFVGDDRPASAPPEMTQSCDGLEKMTYEQKYEQFLQQMNIISEEKLQQFGRAKTSITATAALALTAAAAAEPVKIKQDEFTESANAMDAYDKLDHGRINHHHQQPTAADSLSIMTGAMSTFRRRRPGKYLRRKGSSGFDYIRKKKKPHPPSATAAAAHMHAHIAVKQLQEEEERVKVKTESDVCREIHKWVLNKGVGQSTMHKAARLGYIDVIVYCLDRMGINPDQKDNAGYTPLHEACTNGWLEIARILLQYGANHSEAALSGIRPLHEASENDHEEIVRLLLSYGADPLLATYSGQTPLMLATSTTMRDLLNNHLSDVQSIGTDRKPWRFNGPWEIFDMTERGYDVFGGAPNFTCDMSRALRKSLVSSSLIANQKQFNSTSNSNHQYGGETSSKTVMDKCAVVLDNIDRFNSVRLYNDNKPEFLVENSDSDGQIFEFEEADVLLPPLYLLEDEGNDKWVLLNDLCNLLKVKSKDTLLNKIYPFSSASTGHKSLMRELKMSDFLEKATCLQLLCAGEKINICASKVVLIKYNESVRNLLGVKTIIMKF